MFFSRFLQPFLLFHRCIGEGTFRNETIMKLPVERLIPEYEDCLYKATFAQLQDPADSPDAVQLTFIKYHQSALDFQDPEHIRRWRFCTVLNQVRDICRAFWRRSRAELDNAA